MWQQNYEPVGGRLVVSALVAAIPIAVLFFMLGVRRKPSWMAALAALGAAFVLALTIYRMPPTLAVASALTGAAYGMFPISWIVFSSILLYRLAVHTGRFEVIKDSVGGLTGDRRLQALFIAFLSGRSSKAPRASGRRSQCPARCSPASGFHRSMLRASVSWLTPRRWRSGRSAFR